MGLLLASRACYDPYHAQYLFHEFARERKEGKMGAQPSAALSTHPLDEVREELRDHVREEKMEAAVRTKIDELRAAADIEVLIAIEPPKSGG